MRLQVRGVGGKQILFAALSIAALLAFCAIQSIDTISRVYFFEQDRWVGLALIALLLLTFAWMPRARLADRPPSLTQTCGAAIALALLLWGGTHWLMFDYPLTRDEHMVVFDADIYRRLLLGQPLAPEWRPFAKALVPAFLLDVPDHALLVSSYMPGNAMMRAAFGLVADPALLNPVLVGVGLIALQRIAVCLFKDCPAAVWVALASYALSAQVLVTAMTTYAMTAHLALNLVWLALFLRGGNWRHALAMVIGVWAIGLHQVIFHPLFAGPFILTLLPKRQWGLFAAYAVVYGGALLFWTTYPSLVANSVGIVAQTGSTGGVSAFLAERVWPLFTHKDAGGQSWMFYNLLRFFAWMPAFLLPLIAITWVDVRAYRPIVLPLFGGIALTLIAMMLLLPYQGHGWGYRYWHGLIGNFSLLAGYGYCRWAKSDRARADGTVWLLGGGTALVLPFLLWTTHSFVGPYAAASEVIGRQRTDFIIVDTGLPGSYAVDEVRNLPDLSNRPLVFSSEDMTVEQMDILCARGSVSLAAGVLPTRGTSSVGPRMRALERRAASRGCLIATSSSR